MADAARRLWDDVRYAARQFRRTPGNAEPDPALFKPPAGYDVLDATPKYPMPQRNRLIVIPARDPKDAANPN